MVVWTFVRSSTQACRAIDQWSDTAHMLRYESRFAYIIHQIDAVRYRDRYSIAMSKQMWIRKMHHINKKLSSQKHFVSGREKQGNQLQRSGNPTTPQIYHQ